MEIEDCSTNLHLNGCVYGGRGRPLTLSELAELLRSGTVEEGPLAEFDADYRAAAELVRKKDD